MSIRATNVAIRAFLSLLLWVAITPLAGCWDRTEINDLAIITAAGIDRGSKENVELSVQVFIPLQSSGGQGQMGGGGGGGGQSAQTVVRSAEGRTVAEAMSKLQEKLSRRIFWGHNEVFIFGEQVAKEKIRAHVDFLMRHPQVRDRAYVLVSHGTAKAVLGLLSPLERSSSEVLREMERSRTGIEVTLKDLDWRLSSDVETVALPWVKIFPPGSPAEKKKGTGIPYIAGTAVFRKDRMVGQLDDRVTRGVLWIRDEIKSAVATVSLEGTDGYISMTLIRSQTKLIPKIENGRWKMTIRSKTEDDVLQNGTRLNILKPEITKMLQEELGKQVENYMTAALDQVQIKMKADILGFGEAFHRAYPKEWNENKDRWDEIFPSVEVQFEIEGRVRRPGEVTMPSALPEDEVAKQ